MAIFASLLLGTVQVEVFGKQRLGPSSRVAAVYFITWPLVHREVASEGGKGEREGRLSSRAAARQGSNL